MFNGRTYSKHNSLYSMWLWELNKPQTISHNFIPERNIDLDIPCYVYK